MHTSRPHHHPLVQRHLTTEHDILTSLAMRKKTRGLVSEHEEIRVKDIKESLKSAKLEGHAKEIIRRRLTEVNENLEKIKRELNTIQSNGIEQERRRYNVLAEHNKTLKSFDEYLKGLKRKFEKLDREMQILTTALRV
jgi:hypothetical protein